MNKRILAILLALASVMVTGCSNKVNAAIENNEDKLKLEAQVAQLEEDTKELKAALEVIKSELNTVNSGVRLQDVKGFSAFMPGESAVDITKYSVYPQTTVEERIEAIKAEYLAKDINPMVIRKDLSNEEKGNVILVFDVKQTITDITRLRTQDVNLFTECGFEPIDFLKKTGDEFTKPLAGILTAGDVLIIEVSEPETIPAEAVFWKEATGEIKVFLVQYDPNEVKN